MITPTAKTMPHKVQTMKRDKEVFEKIRALRGQIVLPKGETTKDLIEAGRRI
jgi:hypothetical protein